MENCSVTKFWNELYQNSYQKLPWINNPTAPHVLQFLDSLPANSTILDYGCGNGRYMRLALEKGGTVKGVDIAPRALQIAAESCPSATLEYANHPSQLDDTEYDGILLWGVLHHIAPSDRTNMMESLTERLKVGGKLIIGGWSSGDTEFLHGSTRISDITLSSTWEIDTFFRESSIGTLFAKQQMQKYEFLEAGKNKIREFSVYLLEDKKRTQLGSGIAKEEHSGVYGSVIETNAEL